MILRQADESEVDREFIGQAIVKKPPSYFQTAFGADFDESIDDLDWYKLALFWLDGEVLFAIRQYRGQERDTVTICLPKDSEDEQRITSVVDRILEEFRLVPSDVVWRRGWPLPDELASDPT